MVIHRPLLQMNNSALVQKNVFEQFVEAMAETPLCHFGDP